MIVGIDLGTTNSLIGVWRDGRPELIPNALGKLLTPSCVNIDREGRVLVGAAARDRLLTDPKNTAAAFKRYMGTEHKLKLGDRAYRPEELSALLLQSLKADAEAVLGEPVTEAVITVPAYFNDTQRKATRIAGEMAGLKVERLLNEPTAAALAYGLHHADPESQFLVFDLGGGTFDVSILELFSGVMEVRATAGDNFLGGEDFVSVLVEGFLAQTVRMTGSLTPAALKARYAPLLRAEATRVMHELSRSETVTFRIPHDQSALEWEVTGEHFEKLAAPLLARLRTPVERSMRDARISASALSRIVLVGGATRMPLVHRLVSRMFGRFPSRDINPDEAIAMGAAVQAGLKMRDAALSDVVMTDVCPYTLGTEVSEEYGDGLFRDGVFMPVIERNTVIPVSRAEVVSPTRDYQKQVDIKVYQGESRLTSENVLLGRLVVPLPPRKRAEQQVELRFTYDVNGLLEVEATTLVNGQKRSLVIEQSPGSMSKEEVRQSLESLSKLKVHPRDEAENLALIARLKRLYEQTLGARREWLGHQLTAFQGLVERQNLRDIAEARAKLSTAMDEIDQSPLA